MTRREEMPMSARRYSDEDARRILALAAEAEAAAGTDTDRPWTLDDVARIGAEAGLAPQAVEAAALALERQAEVGEPARYFGLPVAVSRSVPLSRGLTDEDWERLVGQLRDTFATGGRTQVSGARREWRVGNLRVTHVPAGSGALLELRTRKGDARAFMQVGVVLLVVAAIAAILGMAGMSAAPAGSGSPGDARRLAFAGITAVGGLLMLIVGALRLPAWARERARQFEALAAYARRITSS
jgi:hypothetical protein